MRTNGAFPLISALTWAVLLFFSNTSLAAFSVTYQYDGQGRLLRAAEASGGFEEFTYDAAGNILLVRGPLDPSGDEDGDGLTNGVEAAWCTSPTDADSDEDGITDGDEDANHNGQVDDDETDPCDIDTDGDGLQDGTEIGLTLDDIGPDTDAGVFQPDLDPFSTTDPLNPDTDGDGIPDGVEDANHDGRLDADETDPGNTVPYPTAEAGPIQTASPGETVRLEGGNSFAADGYISSYEWIQADGPTVELSDAYQSATTFTAPAGPASLKFQLTVMDDSYRSASDYCIVNVVSTETPPLAVAGADQTLGGSAQAVLYGDDSSDPDGATIVFDWSRILGPPVELSDASESSPTFTTPPLYGASQSIDFELTVTDSDGLRDVDRTAVNVTDTDDPPAAVAGADATVIEGDTVTLDGSASTDAQGDIASYRWRQVSGPPVILSDPTAASPTFVAPQVEAGAPQDLVFSLTVTDSVGLTSSDEITITVVDNGLAGGEPGRIGLTAMASQIAFIYLSELL